MAIPKFRKRIHGAVMLLAVLALCASGLTTPAFAYDRFAIYPQISHSHSIQTIAFSPDNRFLVTGGLDKTIKIWDLPTGREFLTLKGNKSNVIQVAVSHDNSFLVSADSSGRLIFWDMTTGSIMKEIKTDMRDLKSLVLSPDDTKLLSGGSNKIKLWDVANGSLLSELAGGTIMSLAFSPDGRRVLSGSTDKSMILWDITNGQVMQTFSEHPSYATSVAFSPDGRTALSGIYGIIKMWDIMTGKLKQSSVKNNKVQYNDFTFSPDGKFAYCDSSDESIKQIDLRSGKIVRSFRISKTDPDIPTDNTMALSPDGSLLVSASWNREIISIWNTASGKVTRHIKKNTGYYGAKALSPDGRYFISGDGSQWSLVDGKQIRSQKWGKTVFSRDGKYALESDYSEDFSFRDVEQGVRLHTFTGHLKPITSLVFAINDMFAITGSKDRTVKLWNLTDRENVPSAKFNLAELDAEVSALAISPDGSKILSGTSGKHNGEITLWNLYGEKVQTFKGSDTSYVKFLGFSPDGKTALSSDIIGINIIFWDISTGKEVNRIKFGEYRSSKEFGYDLFNNCLAFSKDGKTALMGVGHNMFLWDLERSSVIQTYKGHTDMVNFVAFTPDGKSVMSGSEDSTTRLWDLKTGKEHMSFVAFSDGEWITITAEGYYVSSLHGSKYLNVRLDDKVYGVDQFYDAFYRPDIVAAKLAGEDISKYISLTIEKAIKNSPPKVSFTTVPAKAAGRTARVCYQAKNSGGGIGDVRLFHNGKLAVQATPVAAQTSRDSYSDCAEIDAVPGENDLSLYVFNAQNSVHSHPVNTTFTSTRQKVEPHLYLLSIGISKYSDSNKDISTSARDGRDIAAIIPEKAKSTYKPANIHVEMLLDKQATKKEILRRIEQIARVIQPWDSFILSIATHGGMKNNLLFLLTTEGNYISSKEISDISMSLKALSQLYIIQACNSGGIDSTFGALYDARMSVLANKMGLHVFAASERTQFSFSRDNDVNSFFIAALLDGFKAATKADLNNDGGVSVAELGQYSRMKTIDSTQEVWFKGVHLKQTPYIINFGRDFPLYRVKE